MAFFNGGRSRDGENYAKPRRRGSLNGLLSFFVVIIAVIFAMSVVFRVSDIRVYGNTHYTDMEIINAIDIEEGDNLFFFDRFAAVSRVFAKLPYVEEVQITRNLPNRVIIDVTETKAIAYLKIGNELWTLDHNCKVLGKATEDERESLVPVTGLNPDTLLINERLKTKEATTRTVDYLDSVLHQLQGRSMLQETRKIDFSDPNNVIIQYGGKYVLKLGDPYATDHKFSMISSALSKLLPGDIGILDVTDGSTVHFIPY